MSYNVYLVIDTGGPHPAVVADCGNMTSNVAPMWRKAGADLAEFGGRSAAECIPLLRTAIAAMEDDPATYQAMAPDNGWGSAAGCLRYLREILSDFVAHPKAIVSVSR